MEGSENKMKKLLSLLVVTVLLASLMGPTVYAGSASVSITNTQSVEQGKKYSYTITINIKDSFDSFGTISFSGIFQNENITFDYKAPGDKNASGKITKKVSFSIPANAELGSTGTITVNGWGTYLVENNDVVEYPIKKTLTATVIAPKPAATKKPSSPSNPDEPAETAAPTQWEVAAQNVETMQAGGAVSVDATQDTKVPASLLTSLKEKKGKLTVNMGAYSCTIDGAALPGTPAADSIDLAMKMEKNAALSAAAGGADAYQLHFANAGQLPGRFTYTFKAEANKPGDKLYLYYYYDQPGVLEGLQSAVVDDNGFVSFVVYHCSSYVVSAGVIEGAAGSLAAAAAGEQAAQEAQGKLTELEGQLAGEKDRAAQMENQLAEAREGATELENQLAERNGELESLRGEATALKAKTEGKFVLPLEILAGAALALVLLTALVTMAVTRAGLFRRRDADAAEGRHIAD